MDGFRTKAGRFTLARPAPEVVAPVTAAWRTGGLTWLVKATAGSLWRESEHPRDRRGRWIRKGARVSILGGGTGVVEGMLQHGRVSVRRDSDGQTVAVDQGYITVIREPDGAAPETGGEPDTAPAQAPDAAAAPAQAPEATETDAPAEAPADDPADTTDDVEDVPVGDLQPGDRVVLDGRIVRVDAIDPDDDLDGYIRLEHADGIVSIPDDEHLPRVTGEPDSGGGDDTEPNSTPGTFGALQPGDRFTLGGRPARVTGTQRAGFSVWIDLTWEDTGEDDSVLFPDDTPVTVLPPDLPPPPPPSPTQEPATARPVLYTYQRRHVVALGWDDHEDEAVREGARRVRARQPITAAQSSALADALRAETQVEGVRPVRARTLNRMAAAFDAATGEAESRDARPPVQEGVEPVGIGDYAEGDTIAVPTRDGITAGRVVSDRPLMSGRLHQVVIERPGGERETLLVSRRTTAYLLPDLPPDEPAGPMVVRYDEVRAGDRITVTQGGIEVTGLVEGVEDEEGEDENGRPVAGRMFDIIAADGTSPTVTVYEGGGAVITRLEKGGPDAEARIEQEQRRRREEARVGEVAERLQKIEKAAYKTAASAALEYLNSSSSPDLEGMQERLLERLDAVDLDDALGTLNLATTIAPGVPRDAVRPQLRALTAQVRQRAIERVGQAIADASPTPGMDNEGGEWLRRAIRPYYADPNSLTSDWRTAARSLIGAERERSGADPGTSGADTAPPDVPEGGDLQSRLAAYRAALPANSAEDFGTAPVRVARYGRLSLEALEAGQVPEVEVAEVRKQDRAADDGPGETAMRHLDVVRAAGRELNDDLKRRIKDRTSPEDADLLRQHDKVVAEVTAAEAAYHARHDEVVARIVAEVDPSYRLRSDVAKGMKGKRGANRQRYTDALLRSGRPEQEDEELQALEQARRTARRNRMSSQAAIAGIRKRLAASRREAALELLAEVRPMGGTGLTWMSPRAVVPMDEDHELVRAMRDAEAAYPTEWLDRARARGPIKLGKTTRGYYYEPTRDIRLSAKQEKVDGLGVYGDVAVHELGHEMERAVPGLLRAEEAMLWARTSQGEVGSRAREALTRIYEGPKEVGYRDEFPEHYTGKEYGGRAYEVFTTQIESLVAGSPYADDDLQAWTLGVLAMLDNGRPDAT